MIVSPELFEKEKCSTPAIFQSILSSVSAVIVVSASVSKNSSTPFKSLGLKSVIVFVLSLITYIEAPLAGAVEKVILFNALLPSAPNVNALPVPGSCLTLFTNTSKEFSPPEGTSSAKSNAVVDPSPVKLSLLGNVLNSITGLAPIYAIYYTSSNTDTVTSKELAALAIPSKLSAFDPSFCNTNLFPDITSKEEPEGILASLTI